MNILQMVLGFFSGGAGRTVGTAVANGSALLALAPLVYWYDKHNADVAVTFSLSYAQLALVCLVGFFIIKVVHYTPPRPPL